jgi:hypothetical protein
MHLSPWMPAFAGMTARECSLEVSGRSPAIDISVSPRDSAAMQALVIRRVKSKASDIGGIEDSRAG